VAPEQAVYLGWSLGGALASALAVAAPQRVRGLITLCSNPRFVQPDLGPDQWSGIPAQSLQVFFQLAKQDPAKALKRFNAWQVGGSPRSRDLLRTLHVMSGRPDGSSLGAGLGFLATLDFRRALADLSIPQLHVFAENDEVVPVTVLKELEGTACKGTWRMIAGASHLLPLENPPAVAAEISAFWSRHELIDKPDTTLPAVMKSDIARSFSRAAAGYDSVAALQRSVGEQLLSELPLELSPAAAVLDLGCGTGHFLPALQERFFGASLLALDLAWGMVNWAREYRSVDVGWCVGDAENLPLASASLDLVFSSLVIQWCQQPASLWAEISRVLKPGGMMAFATLGPATLGELRRAWASVDSATHVNSFIDHQSLQHAVATAGGLDFDWYESEYVMTYSRVRELLDELKSLGAHNMNRGRQSGLTGRRQLQGMLAAYEQERRDSKLPATYQVIFGRVKKQ